MEEINVEEIMKDIRDDIRVKGYTEDMLSFKDVECVKDGVYEYDQEDYKQLLSDMEKRKTIPWYCELGQNGIRKFIKKFIRKSVGFLIAPITDGQNGFNSMVTDGFEQLAGFIENQKEELEKNRRYIIMLEEKIEEMQQEIETLKKK